MIQYPHTQNFSTPSDEAVLRAIMSLDAAVLADRDECDGDTIDVEAGRRDKISASMIGKKQSPATIAKKVAAFKAARLLHPLTDETRAKLRAAGRRSHLIHKSKPCQAPGTKPGGQSHD